MVKKIKQFLSRNTRKIDGTHIRRNEVNLEWWNKKENLGDTLARVIYDYMLQINEINAEQKITVSKHLMTVGSIIGMSNFDATIWGSGIHTFNTMKKILKHKWYVKYDIRAVRGPVTGEVLRAAGYNCPNIYGDPAILMPRIYNPTNIEKKYKVSIIYHISQIDEIYDKCFHHINVQTSDYKTFIDEIQASEMVISSSLHGIILAETYGVPAVFLMSKMNLELMKFLDWYYATNRYSVIMAKTVEEAVSLKPMPLPKLEEMQKNLLKAFPADLWKR